RTVPGSVPGAVSSGPNFRRITHMRPLILAGPRCVSGSAGPRRRVSRGRPQAQDVPGQHPSPSFAVEGGGAVVGAVREPLLPSAEAAARGLPVLRSVRRSSGRPAGLIGG